MLPINKVEKPNELFAFLDFLQKFTLLLLLAKLLI